MVSTRNTSRSNVNPSRMQDPPSDIDSRPPDVLEVMQANTNEVEALRLTNQSLIEKLEQLTRQMQRPREARQTQEGHNIPRGAETEAEFSQAKGHEPQLAPRGEGNGATLGGCVGNYIIRVKEVVRGRAPDTMDTLVQQTESPFIAEVLHFPLTAKFRMPQVEAFDGTRDPVDHLNTYKTQMEFHGYQDPVRCRAFAITLKGPA